MRKKDDIKEKDDSIILGFYNVEINNSYTKCIGIQNNNDLSFIPFKDIMNNKANIFYNLHHTNELSRNKIHTIINSILIDDKLNNKIKLIHLTKLLINDLFNTINTVKFPLIVLNYKLLDEFIISILTLFRTSSHANCNLYYKHGVRLDDKIIPIHICYEDNLIHPFILIDLETFGCMIF